jgi:hypothetical protein
VDSSSADENQKGQIVSARIATSLEAQARPRPPLRIARFLKLSRDLREVPVERYRLPTDGRKWKAIARERMALAEWLSTYGDADGTRIWPSVGSMVLHFGWSRGKMFYLLADLRKLKLLDGEPAGRRGGARTAKDPRGALTGEHGTRKRRMNLAAFLGAEVQDSQNSPAAEVQDSGAEVQSNVGHNRHLTDTKTTPPTPPHAGGTETYFWWCREIVGVFPNGHKRILTDREKDILRGARANDVVEHLNRKGFRARVVPNLDAGAA